MRVLVTGGSGAFGTAFITTLIRRDWAERAVVYSRGEFRQFQMAQELTPLDGRKALRFMIGDVRDRSRLTRAMRGIDIVVHAAALKRIEVGFYNPVEMVKTNIDGAINIIEAAQDAGVKKVVALSTDKAFEPVSPYGASKALAESLFLAANNTTGKDGPRFAVCRYGNVAGSTGSVIPIWRNLLKTSDTVPVTDPEVTRFWMFMDEAVKLVLNTIDTMKGGEIAIPTLPAYRLGDLAEAMGAKIKTIGLPKFEKIHESMEAGNSSESARRLTVLELKKMLEQV